MPRPPSPHAVARLPQGRPAAEGAAAPHPVAPLGIPSPPPHTLLRFTPTLVPRPVPCACPGLHLLPLQKDANVYKKRLAADGSPIADHVVKHKVGRAQVWGLVQGRAQHKVGLSTRKGSAQAQGRAQPPGSPAGWLAGRLARWLPRHLGRAGEEDTG